ncbi:hypothetical protein TOPH_03574 [Tolypocladium ophioglossoides CBS 100239]|uniref:Uncharacterized protein n=1 Tax=Tolypocladium ophioglossoides (strain CBS 100239) TaxID=1163406 RepID=A0A0L0NDT2_TOLOC|nr:hypothetical protein TOPH_03574 [Tolypocladium ophioglossoides CBS 100239]
MQHIRAHGLRQKTGKKRRHRTAQAAARADGPHAAQRVAPRHAAHEDCHGARVDGSQQQADDGHGHGVAHDVGHPPHEHLEGDGADDEPVDEDLLADALRRAGQAEAAEGDARPEASRDVAHRRRVAAARVDEERDDPARDGHLGALVREDEDGAKQHDALLQARHHAQHEGAVLPRLALPGRRAQLLFKPPERPGRQRQRREADAQREDVVPAPDGARDRHERRRDEGPRGAAEAAEHQGAVLEHAAEDVAHGDVDGDAEADEEEGEDDEDEGRRRDERDVGARHERLAQPEQPGAAELGAQHVEQDGGDDEADGLAHEYEGHDAVANVVSLYKRRTGREGSILLHIRDQSTSGTVAQGIAQVGQAHCQQPEAVHERMPDTRHGLDGVRGGIRRRRPAHLEVIALPPGRHGARASLFLPRHPLELNGVCIVRSAGVCPLNGPCRSRERAKGFVWSHRSV